MDHTCLRLIRSNPLGLKPCPGAWSKDCPMWTVRNGETSATCILPRGCPCGKGAQKLLLQGFRPRGKGTQEICSPLYRRRCRG